MSLRRLWTIPLFLAATALLTLLAPALLLLGWLLGWFPASRGALPTIAFLIGYLWCETLGIVASFWIWLRYREPAAFLTANFRLQCWWANALKVLAERLFQLRFQVTGTPALNGPPALLLPRHASMADTVIPMVFYAIPRQVRLRYVLKRELLVDPCLDIVGQRLPNYFVDRSGQDSERAVRGVAALVAALEPYEGALIYPEGTRFSREKHAALRARSQNDPERLAQLDRWTDLLPPRLGGTLAMLGANPGRDLLFCAHTGFEGSTHFSNLFNGAWRGSQIRIHFWRVPYAEVPGDAEGQRRFLFAQWDRMQETVRDLKA